MVGVIQKEHETYLRDFSLTGHQSRYIFSSVPLPLLHHHTHDPELDPGHVADRGALRINV